MNSPAKTEDQRDWPPYNTFSAVPLSEPPTGKPWNSPQDRFAAPMAMKSRERSRGDPSGLGTLWLTPTDCTRITIATAAAPETTCAVKADSGGSMGSGKPLGISPLSRTRLTWSSPNSTTASEGTTMARSRPSLPTRVSGSPVARPSVSAASASEGH